MDVSIIIPFKDDIKLLNSLIQAINLQKTNYTFDVIILDSSNNDFQKDLISFDIYFQWIKINPKEFNHGVTRNYGLSFTNSKFIIFTVQDAVPADEHWLDNLIQPMIENNLDAICGQQIVPHEKSKNPVQWFRPVDEPKFRIIDISYEEYIRKSPFDRRMVIGWDNVNACYTKEILDKMPFAELNFGEDAFWADQALKNGYKIAFTGYAQVHHYHHYNYIQDVVRRVIAEYLVLKKVYNLDPTPPSVKISEMVSIVKLIFISNISIFDKLYWLKYNFKIQWAFFHAYQIWCGFSSIIDAEDYINNKVPQSTKNVRK